MIEDGLEVEQGPTQAEHVPFVVLYVMQALLHKPLPPSLQIVIWIAWMEGRSSNRRDGSSRL